MDIEYDNGYDFWARIDKTRGGISLLEFGEKCGINYSSLKSMRSRCQIPRVPMLIAISNEFNVSIDYLLKGTIENITPEMAFVRDNEAARLLVRKMMDNPPLVEALAAVAALADKDTLESKQA